jgi:uncharacterized protein (DUF427 family)
VRIALRGVTIAETHRAQLLLETGLPTRYYIPQQDIRMEFLEPTETTTRCPYKGMVTYWSASIGEQVFKDIVWSYQEPLPECTPIAHFLCLYNERVDAISVNDELMLVPTTMWSDSLSLMIWHTTVRSNIVQRMNM